MTATATATTTTKRHPIRAFLYGIPFGLGLAFVVIGQKWAALGTWPPFIVFLVGLVAATLWGTFGPAKKPKGSAPEPEPIFAEAAPVEPPPMEPPPLADEVADEVADEIAEPDPPEEHGSA